MRVYAGNKPVQYIFERLMKRKALMIGNSRGLKATPLDMLHFTQFLMSYQGGAWTRDEIEPWMDKDVNELLNDVEKIVKDQNDYVIVYFTGHGGLHGDTIIEVNPKGELIKENSLFGLADRQLNILDCCRNIQTTPLPIYGRSRGMGTMEQGLRDAVRAEYDELVMNAAPQFVKMYSCAEDESSYTSRTLTVSTAGWPKDMFMVNVTVNKEVMTKKVVSNTMNGGGS